MVYPPAALPTDATDALPQTNEHPGRHNNVAAAVNDIVAELGDKPSAARKVQSIISAQITATNAPAAPGMEPGVTLGISRAFADARRASHLRVTTYLSAVVAANGNTVDYSTDRGTTWTILYDSTAGVHGGYVLSDWIAIPAAAKVADLMLRIMVYGDGVADPVVRRCEVEFGAP